MVGPKRLAYKNKIVALVGFLSLFACAFFLKAISGSVVPPTVSSLIHVLQSFVVLVGWSLAFVLSHLCSNHSDLKESDTSVLNYGFI